MFTNEGEADINLGENNSNVEIEKEKVIKQLEAVDKAKLILEKKYPSYGILRDFIDHLASTEKVFILAGIKKFGGEEKMEVFLKSETTVMANETGIDEDVFNHIARAFVETHKSVIDIKDVAEKLMEKYPQGEKFIDYAEDYLILLLEASSENEQKGLDLDEKREVTIHEMIVEIAENDRAEIEKLESIYQEFKDELKKVSV